MFRRADAVTDDTSERGDLPRLCAGNPALTSARESVPRATAARNP
jgi:hypothetical protein